MHHLQYQSIHWNISLHMQPALCPFPSTFTGTGQDSPWWQTYCLQLDDSMMIYPSYLWGCTGTIPYSLFYCHYWHTGCSFDWTSSHHCYLVEGLQRTHYSSPVCWQIHLFYGDSEQLSSLSYYLHCQLYLWKVGNIVIAHLLAADYGNFEQLLSRHGSMHYDCFFLLSFTTHCHTFCHSLYPWEPMSDNANSMTSSLIRDYFYIWHCFTTATSIACLHYLWCATGFYNQLVQYMGFAPHQIIWLFCIYTPLSFLELIHSCSDSYQLLCPFKDYCCHFTGI